MKDIVWTIIVVWLIYRFVQLFKSVPAAGSVRNESIKQAPAEKPKRSDLDSRGEYVDFEEIR